MVDDVHAGSGRPGQLIGTGVQVGGQEHHLLEAGFDSSDQEGVEWIEEVCRMGDERTWHQHSSPAGSLAGCKVKPIQSANFNQVSLAIDAVI